MNIQKTQNQQTSFGSYLFLNRLGKKPSTFLVEDLFRASLHKKYNLEAFVSGINMGPGFDIICTADKSQDDALRKFAKEHNTVSSILIPHDSTTEGEPMLKYAQLLMQRWNAPKGAEKIVPINKISKKLY